MSERTVKALSAAQVVLPWIAVVLMLCLAHC